MRRRVRGRIWIGAIALWMVQGMFSPGRLATSTTAVADATNTSDFDTHINSQIRTLRTGKLAINVIDSLGKPVENAQVHIAQTAHHFEFGVSLRTQLFADTVNPHDQAQYLAIARDWFNVVVPEDALKWYSTEPVQGQVTYADIDRILTWSEQNHLPLRGHHLFWAVEKWNQDWLKTLSNTELRAVVENRANEVCTRYRGRIKEYDVLNEILNGTFFQERLGDGIIKDMFLWCHQADPEAKLFTNEYNILNGEQRDRYLALIDSLRSQGVPLGGIGIQAHIRQSTTPQQIQQNLDALASAGLPIKLTEVSVVADSDDVQAQVLSDLYQVAFAHPAVTGIYLWGFWEGSNWEPESAIFRQDFTPKLAAQTYHSQIYRQWWTDEKKLTDTQGRVVTRAFFGTYHITASAAGKTVQITIDLLPDEESSQVVRIVMGD